MKKLLFIAILIFSLLFIYYVSKPQDANSPCHVVLKYEDFGSDAISSKLLGQAWWQWYPAYGVPGSKFDIKVVVYTQAEDLEKIKTQYPVIEEKNQDYRYVTFTAVMQYLKRIETEDEEYFKGCRADGCLELEFFDSLHKQLKPLNVSHCTKN